MRGGETSTCDNAPWYTAPVIVGGSGGSGTRGVALLLESLGVRMACIGEPSLADPAICDLPCNAAADCGLINSFRGGDGLGWLRANFSLAQRSRCDDVDLSAVAESTNKSNADLCGGSKAAALRLLQHAVRPPFRRPLRWGLKNPHSMYYVNVLRETLFPCLVYVNTVRDLDVMVATLKHFESRVQEALRFGVIDEGAGSALLAHGQASRRRERSGVVPLQHFYGSFVREVNVGLEVWLRRCMPGRSVHVPLQRMVLLAPRAPECVHAVARPLAHALRLDVDSVLNTTRDFAARSLPLVQKSLAEARARQSSVAGAATWGWPADTALEPSSCSGQP